MAKRKIQQLTQKEIERSLSQQTVVILSAVEKKLEKMELRISQKIDRSLLLLINS